MKKKILAACLVVCLLATAVIGTTLAYFTDKTQTKTNTFTMGNVDIELAEKQWDEEYPEGIAHVQPSQQITKDPTVTVVKGSEDCYVFVKLEKGTNVDKYLSYSIDTGDTGWTPLGEDYEGIYYRSYTTDTENDVPYTVLTNNQVTVKPDVAGVAEGDDLTLSFTAYAIQSYGFESAEQAWTAYNTQNSVG